MASPGEAYSGSKPFPPLHFLGPHSSFPPRSPAIRIPLSAFSRGSGGPRGKNVVDVPLSLLLSNGDIAKESGFDEHLVGRL